MKQGEASDGTTDEPRGQFARVITHKPRNFRRRRNISPTRTIFLNASGELSGEDERSTTKRPVVEIVGNRRETARAALPNSKGKQLCKRTARHSPRELPLKDIPSTF